MPWKETLPMKERTLFVVAYESGTYTMTELCTLYQISRKTGYKWLQRYKEEGDKGLTERSRAPHSSPHQTPDTVAEAVIACRKAHPTWGQDKIIAFLTPRVTPLPAPSTVGAILKRAGLVSERRRRKHSPALGTAPNSVWTLDFKGEFKTQDGVLCYPLTVADAYSRYLLLCHALPSTGYEGKIGRAHV